MRLDLAGVPLPSRSRRAVKTRHLLAAVSGLAVLLSAGCGGSGGPGGPVSSTITIAVVPGIDNAPVYIAAKDGLFTAAGLGHVVIKTYSTEAAEMNALASNQANIAASDYGDIFAAQSTDLSTRASHLQILADGYDATAGALEVLTWPGSKIKSPAELASSQTGPIGLPSESLLPSYNPSSVVGPASLDAAAATNVLSNYLGNAATSIQWAPMTQAQEVTELRLHQLNAILVSEPYIFQAEQEFGAVEVLDACSGSTTNLPLSGYAATDVWAKQYPSAVADFQSAIAKANADASTIGQVQQILPHFAGMSVQEADLATVGIYPTTTSANDLDRVVRLLYNYTMLKGQIPQVAPMLMH